MADPDEIPIGVDGAAMLALSLLVMLLSGGTTFLAAVWQVWHVGRRTPCAPDAAPAGVLILGQALTRDGLPAAPYRARLERARRLAMRWPGLRLVVLGGRTGTAPVSEAEAGRRHLVAGGVDPTTIVLEDRSRHTLENLVHYRARLAADHRGPPLLVTSRFHLARSALLARGLGIAHAPCAAEDQWRPGPALALPIVKEAVLIQWYITGRLFARWTGNRRMTARIS